MPPRDIDELRIAPRRPDRDHVAERKDHHAGDPQPQAEPDRGGQRCIGDRQARAARRRAGYARSARGERARQSPARLRVARSPSDQRPPPNEKNDRKKEEAANAIDRPNTIWIIRRAPPEVSPKASARPVAMMIMTATILATGPWMDSRIDWSGASHGIDEPAAWAGLAMDRATKPPSMAAERRARARDKVWITMKLLWLGV